LTRAAAFAEAMATLSDAAVRDLAWLLLAPRLLSEAAFGALLVNPPLDPELLSWLHALDNDPALLHAALAPLLTRRVGHYAEGLVHYALSHSTQFQLVAANLPLRVQKQTVGECDFLLEDRAGQRLHWELAVKCYLHVDALPQTLADPLASFVGPALGDRLDIKLRRMLDHQLPLSGRPDYAALLPPGPWQAQMWVNGWLFDRFDHWRAGRSLNIDARLDPALLSGFWTAADTWPDVSEALGAHGWTRLPRLRWIAPLATPDQSFCDSETMGAQIEAAFALPTNGRDDPFAVAAWKKTAEGRWQELARGFIVADDWEPRAIAFAAT
jgi:uncharacterized protein